MSIVKITIPAGLLSSFSGVKDDYTFALALEAKVAGAESITDEKGENTIFYIYPDLLPLDIAKYVISNNGEVENYPLFIKIDNKNTTVPEDLPHSKDEKLTVKSWDMWKKDNYTFSKEDKDGFIYLGTNAATGEDLPLSKLVPVFDQLIRPKEYKLLFPEEE
jgi:hypothetical protein